MKQIRSKPNKSFKLVSLFTCLSLFSALPAAGAEKCNKIFETVSFRDDLAKSESTGGFFKWWDRLFEKTEEEKLLIEAPKITALLLKEDSRMINQKFKEYAAQSRTIYTEKDGVYIIEPTMDGNALNKFVHSVTKLKTQGLGLPLQFIFAPREASGFLGCYKINEGKIHVSLKSIFAGKPTSTEVHEYLHLKHDLRIKNGEDHFLGFIFSPSYAPFMVNPSYKYSRALSADELVTFSSDLRLLKSQLVQSKDLSRQGRKAVFSSARSMIETLHQNNKIIAMSLSTGMEYLVSNARPLNYQINKFPNGREYVVLIFSFVNASRFRTANPEIVEAVKQIPLDDSGRIITDSEAYKKVLKYYLNQAQRLQRINKELLSMSEVMLEKSKKDKFLMDDAFFDILDRYRGLIKDNLD